MLGVFLEMSRYRLARDHYPFYRERLQQFFDENAIDLAAPKRHSDFADWIDRTDSPMRAVAERSGALSTFCVLGRFAIRFMILLRRNRPEALETRRYAKRILKRCRVPANTFDALATPDAKAASSVNDIVSPALQLGVELLRELRVEPRTCFIAMPFS